LYCNGKIFKILKRRNCNNIKIYDITYTITNFNTFNLKIETNNPSNLYYNIKYQKRYK